MRNITLKQLAVWCNGTLSNGSNENLILDLVTIDSRAAQQNTLFVALKGEQVDGHKFALNVVANESNAALVNIKSKLDAPNLIFVNDTILALGQLAREYRNTLHMPLVGITGSNGKTTLKEMLKSICNYQFGADAVLATSGNLNNHLGLPLTLLAINPNHKVAILEMGMNHSGELGYLSDIAHVDYALINNVMLAHAGHFNSLNAIAKAKGEIFDGLRASSTALIQTNDPFIALWRSKLQDKNSKIYEFGEAGSECFIKCKNVDGSYTYSTSIGEVNIKLNILGEHNYTNALNVIALALNLGCSLENIKLGLENYTGYSGRLEKKTAFNGALIVDDSYNANPDSVKAALAAVKDLPKPLWFIFADIKEQGEKADKEHANLGEYMNGCHLDMLLTVGEMALFANQEFEGYKQHFSSNADIIQFCQKNLPASGTLLLKGSNSMNLKEIVSALS